MSSVSRRVFLSTSIGVAVAQVAFARASAQDAFADGDRVDVFVSIEWSDGKPVVGARVFDHIPNKLLGETNDTGEFFFTADYGAVVRLVEPEYGLQQSLFKVEGKPRGSSETKPGNNSMIAEFAEGWTLK